MLRHGDLEKTVARPREKLVTDCARARRYNFPSPLFRECPLDHQNRNAAYSPKSLTSELRTRSAIAQACLRSSTSLARSFCRPFFLTPTICSLAGQPDLVEDTPNHCVDDSGQRTGTAVEGGNRGENNCAGLKQSHNVAGVNQIPRRFPRDEDKLSPLFEENICRAQQDAIAGTGSNSPQRGHRTRDDHHCVETSRAAHKWHVHVTFRMVRNFCRNFEIIELLLRNCPRVCTHDEMHLVCRAIDLFKQTLQIDRTACTGGGDDELHVCLSVISSEARDEVEKSLGLLNITQRSSTSLDTIEKDPNFINTGLQPSDCRSTRNEAVSTALSRMRLQKARSQSQHSAFTSSIQ